MTGENTDPRPYVCEYCGKKYKSRQALSKHKKTCESRPDREEEHEEAPDNTPGIDLYGDEDDEDTGHDDANDDDDDDGDTYGCPCGYEASRKFNFCPECGAQMEW